MKKTVRNGHQNRTICQKEIFDNDLVAICKGTLMLS